MRGHYNTAGANLITTTTNNGISSGITKSNSVKNKRSGSSNSQRGEKSNITKVVTGNNKVFNFY